MKLVVLIFYLGFIPFVVLGQGMDAERVVNDSTHLETSNAFIIHEKNYETVNNSFITGNSRVMIRSQSNPKLLLDGIPVNPILFNSLHYTEFQGSMHVLSFDMQNAGLNYLQHDDKIISGHYNNAISFKTQDIILGNYSPLFEVNSFSALNYQDIDKTGGSTILNFNVQQGFKNFGYRISFNNGFQNDYLPENGLQRYGSNIKLKYEPHEQISFTGFLDYTTIRDFGRSEVNIQKSNRLLAYINADAALTKWLSFFGKFGLNSLSDVSERVLNQEVFYGNDYQYTESYFRKNNFEYNSVYADFGFSLHREFEKNRFIKLKLGYSQNSTNYFDEIESNYQSSQGDYAKSWSKREPEDKERTGYVSLNISNESLNIAYLLNSTNYSFGNLVFREKEDKTFYNHLLSVRYDAIRNNSLNVNNLGFQFDFGRLINYSIIPQPVFLNPPPGYQQPEWTTPFDNDNLQIALLSSFLKNRLEVNLSLYQKKYRSFYHLFQYQIWNGNWHVTLEDIGEVTKRGYELYGNYLIVQNKTLYWLVESSYSRNASALDRNQNLMFQLADTLIHNRIISIVNHFAYKSIKLLFEIEGKNGYDINLYRKNISVAEPFSYWERRQVTGINSEGIPTSGNIINYRNYITDINYFVLKQIGLEYHIRDNTRGNNYFIGLQYHKMRRIYFFVDDINTYQEQFQRPSFFNSLSLSFKLQF